MAPPKDIITFLPDTGESTQRISHRPPPPIDIVEYDPAWPARYAELEQKIREALGGMDFHIQHAGSTSVPGLPSKNILDIDVVVPDIDDEAAYVSQLEAMGFKFLIREPAWYEHRLFYLEEPYTNLHVWPKTNDAEAVRHRLFRDWLRTHDDDRNKYAEMKREAAAASRTGGENMIQYTKRKTPFMQGVLRKIFVAEGYIQEGDEIHFE